jgi:hypothetical protein
MFYFRLNKIKIKDNKEIKKFLLFGPSNAEVKIYSFITTDDRDFPEIDELLETDNKETRDAIYKLVLESVNSGKILTKAKNVQDNSSMTFGDSGSLIYQSPDIPEQINWTLVAMECDEDIRNFAEDIDEVINAQTFQKYAGDLLLALTAVINPAYGAVIGLTKYMCHYVIGKLKKNKDDLIGITSLSLNRQQHYPHGERKVNDVWDLTNNMQIDYSMFGFEDESEGG